MSELSVAVINVGSNSKENMQKSRKQWLEDATNHPIHPLLPSPGQVDSEVETPEINKYGSRGTWA